MFGYGLCLIQGLRGSPMFRGLLPISWATVHWGKQESGDRNWSQSKGIMLLSCLFPKACLACFLIPSTTTDPGMTPSQWTWPFHINLYWRHFINCGTSSKITPICVNLTKQLHGTYTDIIPALSDIQSSWITWEWVLPYYHFLWGSKLIG